MFLTNVVNVVLENVSFFKAHKILNRCKATQSVDHLGITDQFPGAKSCKGLSVVRMGNF